jgi:adenylylsulfate kinase-like enzyme
MAGEIADFTGVSAPYEPPESPGVHLHSDLTEPDEAARILFDELRKRGAFGAHEKA